MLKVCNDLYSTGLFHVLLTRVLNFAGAIGTV